MKIEELLPLGSVVLLKEARKKVIIMGVMQLKHNESGYRIYDYLGVAYPEGYLGKESSFLFNHDSIQNVVFRGYVDEERDKFYKIMQKVFKKTEEKVGKIQQDVD